MDRQGRPPLLFVCVSVKLILCASVLQQEDAPDAPGAVDRGAEEAEIDSVGELWAASASEVARLQAQLKIAEERLKTLQEQAPAATPPVPPAAELAAAEPAAETVVPAADRPLYEVSLYTISWILYMTCYVLLRNKRAIFIQPLHVP